MDTNSAIFQQILVRLRAFEAQGLRYRLATADGQEFVSAEPLEIPGKVIRRVNITRSVVISDIVRDRIAGMQVGDVERLMIPNKHTGEITEKSWNSAVSATACRIFGNGGCTVARVAGGVELMRLK